MSDVFTFHEGSTPLLISVPHDGRSVPAEILDRMTPEGRALPDTDWHVAELYAFARELGASMLVANCSRYVVDLNRPASDAVLYPGQVATGLCPARTFAGERIYTDAGVDVAETEVRIAAFWRPYHERLVSTLEALKERYGYALLWDAHSIESRVPRLFDGELPELNLGTYGGASCGAGIEQAIVDVAATSPFDYVVNGRFQGGFITRQYGRPLEHVHAVQLEISQRVYMDEVTAAYDVQKASCLRDTLLRMLETYLEAAERDYV
jgi:N-formylglutamate amidohydrolase